MNKKLIKLIEKREEIKKEMFNYERAIKHYKEESIHKENYKKLVEHYEKNLAKINKNYWKNEEKINLLNKEEK